MIEFNLFSLQIWFLFGFYNFYHYRRFFSMWLKMINFCKCINEKEGIDHFGFWKFSEIFSSIKKNLIQFRQTETKNSDNNFRFIWFSLFIFFFKKKYNNNICILGFLSEKKSLCFSSLLCFYISMLPWTRLTIFIGFFF